MHRSNIMFQCDSHYRCCACIAAVVKCYSLVVQSGRRGGHDMGGGVGKVNIVAHLNTMPLRPTICEKAGVTN